MYFICGMKQCLTLQPNHPQALTNLGNIYMEWYAIPLNHINGGNLCYMLE